MCILGYGARLRAFSWPEVIHKRHPSQSRRVRTGCGKVSALVYGKVLFALAAAMQL
jgi:hypothetical protein